MLLIRFEDNVWRPTTTGNSISKGSSNNDNRAVQMRGWRWTVEGNDYVVHRNWAADKSYRINDGGKLVNEADARCRNNIGYDEVSQ